MTAPTPTGSSRLERAARALDEAKRWAAGEDVPLLHWTVEEVP